MSRDSEFVWATMPEPIREISIDSLMHGLGDPHAAELGAFEMAPRQASFAQAGAV